LIGGCNKIKFQQAGILVEETLGKHEGLLVSMLQCYKYGQARKTVISAGMPKSRPWTVMWGMATVTYW